MIAGACVEMFLQLNSSSVSNSSLLAFLDTRVTTIQCFVWNRLISEMNVVGASQLNLVAWPDWLNML